MGFRIRPASALAVLLAIAFAFQLVAILSVPVTRSITLCTHNHIQFGVLGYCDTRKNTCSRAGVGYSDQLSSAGFSLPSKARHTLSNLLIVHVVAAALTLVLLVMSILAHFHKPAHSSKYLLGMLILALPTFLVSLLAFLVDLLLFLPHLNWAGWLILASTILIAIFAVLLCIMRRTLSSRKAVKQMHKENSELQNLNSNNLYGEMGMVYGEDDNSMYDGNKTTRQNKFEPVSVTQSSITDPDDPETMMKPSSTKQPIAGYQTQRPQNEFNQIDLNNPLQSTNYHMENNNYPESTIPIIISNREYQPALSQANQERSHSFLPDQLKPEQQEENPVYIPKAGADLDFNELSNQNPYGEYNNSKSPASLQIRKPNTTTALNQTSIPPRNFPRLEHSQTTTPRQEKPIKTPSNSSVTERTKRRTRVRNQNLDNDEFNFTTDSQPSKSRHPYSTFDNAERDYRPPAPKWRQRGHQNAPGLSQPSYSPNSISSNYPRHAPTSRRESHQGLRQHYLNNDDEEENEKLAYYNRMAQHQPFSQDPIVIPNVPKYSTQSLETSDSASSHFTSISQREPYPQYNYQSPSARKNNASDFVLSNNPDFVLPSKRNMNGTRHHKQKKNHAPSFIPEIGMLDGPYNLSRGA